jgi:predicted nucleotidyltransferase
VLELELSPLVVHTTPEHAEVNEIAAQCVTRQYVHHYLGFTQTQWKLFEKENPPWIKPILCRLSLLRPRFFPDAP